MAKEYESAAEKLEALMDGSFDYGDSETEESSDESEVVEEVEEEIEPEEVSETNEDTDQEETETEEEESEPETNEHDNGNAEETDEETDEEVAEEPEENAPVDDDNGEMDEELFDYVLQGMKLVQMDTLGGSGSRGYGKVKFEDVTVTYPDGTSRDINIDDIPLQEIAL